MSYTKPYSLNNVPGGDSVRSAIVDKLDGNATRIVADLNTHEAMSEIHGATGAIVGTTNTQTLTNKTLMSPVITTPAYSGEPLVYAKLSSSGNLQPNIPLLIQYSEVFDLGNDYAAGRFTATMDGYYKVEASLAISHSVAATKYFWLFAYLNGSTKSPYLGYINGGNYAIGSIVFHLVPGDYVEIYGAHDDTDAKTPVEFGGYLFITRLPVS